MLYNIQQFGHMITDTVRMGAYLEALRRTVKPGSVVVDIGAGMGVFALIACQLGARRVYAIESNPLVELGEAMAVANGCADRITFIREMSTVVNLPEQADVIVADLRGQLPLFGYNIASMLDARRRLLKPGGVLLPLRDRIYAALIAAPETYRTALIEPWVENPYKLDMSAVLPILLNHNIVDRERAVTLLVKPQEWFTLEYGYTEEPNVSKTLEWVVDTAGTADFLTVWFDAEIMEGIGYSNAPNNEGPTIYGRAMLPLERPIALVPGDRASVKLSAKLVSGRYQYAWETRVVSGESGQVKANYQQSSFFSATLSEIRKRSSNFIPRLDRDGQATRFILNEMTEGKTLSAIAQALRAAFPQDYATDDDALGKVSAISQRYSE